MAISDLCSLIENLEYGTNLHISIGFFGNCRNSHCLLPREHTIHGGEMCEYFKTKPESYKKCYRCSTAVLQRAARSHRISAGMCIHGIYEYTRPILVDGKLIAVVRIGNILTDEGRKRLCLQAGTDRLPFDRMEENYGYDRCHRLADLIESYIRLLLEKYPEDISDQNLLILNIKHYIKENILYDITVSSVSRLFSYNEAYLGRLFKKEVGCTVKEYLNRERIRLAEKRLLTDEPVALVAQLSGYNNISYFNRIFKKRTGQTPLEYRRAHKLP